MPTPTTPIPSPWLAAFTAETAPVIRDPFLLCLAASVAAVESAWGVKVLHSPAGLNEIGYKAVPGKPSLTAATQESADPSRPDSPLAPQDCAFRLFADRTEQARALLHLFDSSAFYESARLLFALAFYSAYAPGRTQGARALLRVFNRLAREGHFPGVRPFALLDLHADPHTLALNHAAARAAVRLFAELTSATDHPS